MDATMIERMTAKRKETPNVPAPDWAGKWIDGGKGLFLAGPPVRAMVQNLIDHQATPEGELAHGHLAEAKVLVLIRLGVNPDADGVGWSGKAQKATSRDRILAANADFVITINGDTWEEIADLEAGDEPTEEQRAALALRQVYILDHELEHCTYAVEAKTFKLDGKARAKNLGKMQALVTALGPDFIDKDEEGDVGVVRFVKRRKDVDGSIVRPHQVESSQGKLKLSPRSWRTKKDDVLDLSRVIARWGRRSFLVQRVEQILEDAGVETPAMEGATA